MKKPGEITIDILTNENGGKLVRVDNHYIVEYKKNNGMDVTYIARLETEKDKILESRVIMCANRISMKDIKFYKLDYINESSYNDITLYQREYSYNI